MWRPSDIRNDLNRGRTPADWFIFLFCYPLICLMYHVLVPENER